MVRIDKCGSKPGYLQRFIRPLYKDCDKKKYLLLFRLTERESFFPVF